MPSFLKLNDSLDNTWYNVIIEKIQSQNFLKINIGRHSKGYLEANVFDI